MGNIFHVGSPSDVPPVPQGFPKCGNFLPQITQPWMDWWCLRLNYIKINYPSDAKVTLYFGLIRLRLYPIFVLHTYFVPGETCWISRILLHTQVKRDYTLTLINLTLINLILLKLYILWMKDREIFGLINFMTNWYEKIYLLGIAGRQILLSKERETDLQRSSLRWKYRNFFLIDYISIYVHSELTHMLFVEFSHRITTRFLPLYLIQLTWDLYSM